MLVTASRVEREREPTQRGTGTLAVARKDPAQERSPDSMSHKRISTDDRFWDCECDDDYIHLKATQDYCPKCDTYADEQPDSMVDELIAKGLI
jgi:hypothetical protein